ncbi:cellulase family glycosylhydrolase [Kallotenue papyrolyticum]|uniref:cellulase family glycosylhydrolase n=1 Tax=Kallotenue papyrolyticum TaxID=1325125 RepID=UPI00047855AE|nr:cellulase family glycosylhydrolase [Kallotenue papyrolyticum]
MRVWRAILIACALVTGAAQLLTPRTYPPPRLGPQQQVVTANPKIGVHLRLSGTEDEALLQRELSQVREMGAAWVVDLFPWAYVQPRGRRSFDWRGADLLVAHARRQGLQIIARLDIVPAWARPRRSTDRFLDPPHYDDFARYAAAFAARYRDQVPMIVIWNEPNLVFEWGSRPPDPQAYAALLKRVYPAVKQANPTMLIAAGALSPGADVPGTRMDDLAYLRAMLDAGAPFDVLAVHAYGAQAPADEPPHPDRVNFRRVEVYRDLLRARGLAQPLVITEGGWNDHPRWHGAVSPADRLRWTVDAYRLAAAWDDVMAVCLWQFRGPITHTYHDNYNFVAADGTPKAIYWAVQAYARAGVP